VKSVSITGVFSENPNSDSEDEKEKVSYAGAAKEKTSVSSVKRGSLRSISKDQSVLGSTNFTGSIGLGGTMTASMSMGLGTS